MAPTRSWICEVGISQLLPAACVRNESRQSGWETVRGHQLLRSLLALLGLLHWGKAAAWIQGPEQPLEMSRESLELPASLDVLLQSPESLQVLPLQKAVLSIRRVSPRSGPSVLEGRPGKTAPLLDLAHRVAVDGGWGLPWG